MIATVSLEEAEAQASDLHAKIGEHEAFLAGYEQEMDEAVRADVRASSPKTVERIAAIHKRRLKADAELPELRRRFRALSVVVDEEQAKQAEAEKQRRLAELQKYADAEVEAFRAFGEKFAELWPLYLEVRAAVTETHERWRSLVGGDVCELHPLNPLPASFESLVRRATIALTLGDHYASHNPFGRFVAFAELDQEWSLGGGVDTA